MKSQVSGYTVAYASEVFPFFTMNHPQTLVFGSQSVYIGGLDAFFKRADFCDAYRLELEVMGVHVNGDAQLQNVRERDRLYFLILFSEFEMLCAAEERT